ncbi:MAG TPA: nucleotidyltransferase family protein [Chthonomonadaceae bacterium]|nr:nucleotidyltransferase family protein [Chthonomonadaceae bacterium]
MKNIAAIILAAGASERMGQPKQLLPYGGHSLLRHTVETALASCCRPVIVVLGAHAEAIKPEVEDAGVTVVINEAWKEGMSASIRAGLSAVQPRRQATDGALFLLCDQPLVTASLLDRLVTAFRVTGQPIAACDYDGVPGVPALFARSLFPELEALHGAEGAKQVLRRHRSRIACLPFPEGRFDIDTPQDFQALQQVP